MSVVLSGIGFAGAALILLGYAQVSRGAWSGKSKWFQLTNLVGAGLLTIYSIAISAYPTVLLNGVWFVVALVALAKLLKPRR